ncbi:MAG: hypothetical protein WA632_12945 [Gallionella sp.]
MKNKIHHEFIFQSRELSAQIEDTLGDPPDRKYYATYAAALIQEFAKGTEIDDVNLLGCALFGQLRFNNPKGLLSQSKQYDKGDAAKAIAMVSCDDPLAAKALATVAASNPELARKAIITMFLLENSKRWEAEDEASDSEQDDESDSESNEENFMDSDERVERGGPDQDVIDLFDIREDKNGE